MLAPGQGVVPVASVVVDDHVDAWATVDDIANAVVPHRDAVGSAACVDPIASVVHQEAVTALATVYDVAISGIPAAEVAPTEVMQQIRAAATEKHVVPAAAEQVIGSAAASDPVTACAPPPRSPSARPR
jgi:hypothetical protein